VKVCFFVDPNRKIRVMIQDEYFNDSITVVTSICVDHSGNIDIVSQYSTKLPSDVPLGSVVVWKSNVFEAIDTINIFGFEDPEMHVRLPDGEWVSIFNLELLYDSKVNVLLDYLAEKFFGLKSYPQNNVDDIKKHIIATMYLSYVRHYAHYTIVEESQQTKQQAKQLEHHDDLFKKLIELARTLPPDQELEIE